MRLRAPVPVALIAAASLVLAAPASGAGGGSGEEVEASARFRVELGEESGRYDFGQSEIVASTLDGTPQVPVSLHAAEDDFLEEFVLAGRVEEGAQKTSDDAALGLNVTVGDSSMFLNSVDGECRVKVKTLTGSRIAGSFTCDTTYGGEPLTAKGKFMAR